MTISKLGRAVTRASQALRSFSYSPNVSLSLSLSSPTLLREKITAGESRYKSVASFTLLFFLSKPFSLAILFNALQKVQPQRSFLTLLSFLSLASPPFSLHGDICPPTLGDGYEREERWTSYACEEIATQSIENL
ncbi:hypothetical protein NMG60_11024635 [Bertholletia excelsa]